MVSASHNPAEDNGLKVLDSDGLKLDDDIEDELEDLIWREAELGGVGNAELGLRVDAGDAVERYLDHRRGLASSIDAGGLHIVLDGANGSGGAAGRVILRRRAPGWTRSTSNRTGSTSTSVRSDRAAGARP
jgi:phosphoglucosamine mutase